MHLPKERVGHGGEINFNAHQMLVGELNHKFKRLWAITERPYFANPYRNWKGLAAKPMSKYEQDEYSTNCEGGFDEEDIKAFSRSFQPPFEKYDLPLTTNQHYGWPMQAYAPQYERMLKPDLDPDVCRHLMDFKIRGDISKMFQFMNTFKSKK